MERRSFIIATAAGAATLAARGNALEYYPKADKKKWAVLFGSRYGTTRDAAIWISEGMGGVAQVFDVRENPELGGYDHLVVGAGIYAGKPMQELQDYLAKWAGALSRKIRALYVCRGSGDNTPKPYVPVMQTLCKVEPLVSASFPGRITRALLEPDVAKGLQAFYKQQNWPWEDSDKLSRKDCLAFGAEIVAAVQKAKL